MFTKAGLKLKENNQEEVDTSYGFWTGPDIN